jgi:glycosyltransferase involved in cell wall biosynthesis
MNPSVSILIPAHNARPWIGAAIESALGQREAEVEVIVVDDGSTDGTLDEIRRFDGRIRWEAGPNRGAPAARNRALALARASWVQYLDADDFLMPHKVAGQLAALRKHPGADVIYGPSTIEWHGPTGVETRFEPIPEPHDPYLLLALWRLPQTGAPLWRRAALLEVGGWREDQPCCQEHELYLRLLMAGKRFVYDDAGGAVYRRFTDGTLSTRKPSMVRRERRKIETRLEKYLAASGVLTRERQWAIDQARFDMARSAWPVDRFEARTTHAEIVSHPFRPAGAAAPKHYRAAYRLFGFEVAERIAAVRRGLGRRPGGMLHARTLTP